MDNQLILSQVPLPELLGQLRQLVREEILSAQKSQQDELMISAGEACKLFVPAITRPTLDKLCSEGKLTKHFLGSRIYFKRSEVFAATQTFKRYEQPAK